MIFVTVGTDHHQFNRLIQAIDIANINGKIDQKIFMQIGLNSVEPISCSFGRLLAPEEMEYYYKNSTLIVCQAGPGTIFNSLKHGKKPIVIPRDPKYGEVIDDHQLKFAKHFESKGLIHSFFSTDALINNLSDPIYHKSTSMFNFRNAEFSKDLDNVIKNLFDV